MKVELHINCTYSVGFTVDLPKNVVEQLEDTDYIGEDHPLCELIADLVHESDAMDWEYEVVSVERRKVGQNSDNRKFKVDDEITNGKVTRTIISIKTEHNHYLTDCGVIPFDNENEWRLVKKGGYNGNKS